MNFFCRRKLLTMKYLVVSVFVTFVILQLTQGTSVDKDLALTSHEKKTLDKFRERVKPLLKHSYQQSDVYLVRWLRARNFNVIEAENMLKANLKWRQEENIDNILNEDFSDIAKDFHATKDSFDKEGRPVGTIDIYDWDIRSAVLGGRGKRLLRYLDYLMEQATQRVFKQQEKGLIVTQWVTLGNCADFNLVQHGCPSCIPLWIQFVTSLENHYPGWLDELIAIDAPASVNVILEILKPLLSKQTREAIKVFSANRAKWMPYLDAKIDRSMRRPEYGGTKAPLIY